jgi:hypothetical protein
MLIWIPYSEQMQLPQAFLEWQSPAHLPVLATVGDAPFEAHSRLCPADGPASD